METRLRRIGFILNPIAGMGGPAALKGTDGPGVIARARALGTEAVAPPRARRALVRLAGRAGPAIEILASPGEMGAAAAREAGLLVRELPLAVGATTTAADTVAAAGALLERAVALILFAGGDGTARDVMGAVGEAVPLLGIPAGVKMHSAVFAVDPEAAGELAALAALGDPRISFRAAEVMDIDEEAARDGRLSARLHGYARVPFERTLLSGPKSGASGEDATLDALCREVAGEMAPGVLHVIGPGTTTARVLRHLGLEGSLLGVDAVLDGRLLGRDLSRAELERLLAGRPARIILGIIGGQGYIFGRGNQQIGADVIRAVGRDNIVLLASQQKLLGLAAPRLLADTGDPAVDDMLQGFIRVRIAPHTSTLMRVGRESAMTADRSLV